MNITRAAALLVLASVLPGRAFGAAGTASLQFLNLDVGARQVAMAGSGVGLGGDVYSMAQNPAWLAQLSSPELGLSDALWLQDISYQDIFYAHPAFGGVYGLHLQSLGYGTISSYDANGASMGSFGASDLLIGGSYAHYWPDHRLYLGATGKLAQERIGPSKTTGEMLDLGAAWFPWNEGRLDALSFGAALTQLGPGVKFQSDTEPLPQTMTLGAAMRFNESFNTALDLQFPFHGSPRVLLGSEYWFYHEFCVRAGLDPLQDYSEGFGIRAGFGLRVADSRLADAEIDYAFAPMGELGLTHHVTLILRFGGKAEKTFRQGLRLMREDKPAEAILKFEDALRADHNHPEAGQWLRRAQRGIEQSVQETP